MHLRSTAADLLLALARQPTIEEQEASFRSALTALARAAGHMGPPPLDGMDPRAVEAAVSIALQRGLLEKIDFLRPGSAAVALYELSSACPPGELKRDLRRKVFDLLYRGNAGAFLPVATRISLGSAAPLRTQTLRARVGLCLDLPLGSEENVGPLALALATRSSTRDLWVCGPARLALPGRRMAAQLLSHAAREAVARFLLGDAQPRDLLLGRDLRTPFAQLLADREPLVWQHAAVARGLLAAIHPEMRGLLEADLAPQATPTNWRRGLVSLVASMVLGDPDAHSSVMAVLSGPLLRRDEGLAATLLSGLAPVIEAEPAQAENILDLLAQLERSDVAVAAGTLLEQVRTDDFAPIARLKMGATLASAVAHQTPGQRVRSERALRLLSVAESPPDLAEKVQQALRQFETAGAEEAYSDALEIIKEAHELAFEVEGAGPESGERERLLLELDVAVFQRPTLSQLLLLGRRPGAAEDPVEQLERLQNRTSRWILSGLDDSSDWCAEATAFDQHRLTILLRLVDTESSPTSDSASPLAARVQQSILVLLEKLERGADPALHRVLCAALARSFDAAVRDAILRASDLVLVVAMMLGDHDTIAMIAEASTTPDVAAPLRSLAAFLSPEADPDDGSMKAARLGEAPLGTGAEQLAGIVTRVVALSQGVVGGGGYHAEALRRIFFRLGRALEAIVLARGQSELVDVRESGPPVLEELERATEDLHHMTRCAQRRVLGGELNRPSSDYQGPSLRTLLEHSLSLEREPVSDEIVKATEALVLGLPEVVGAFILQVVLRIPTLPRASGSTVTRTPLAQARAPLPNWLLPRRTIGSFYVVRPLGTGGVSSVFVARRLEDKADPKAEAFALKVPEYDPATARSLSEDDFFQMFREEAGALLALPEHENLARFVTFDLSARPRPILVMELIRGIALDRLVRSRSLTLPRVAELLDGILRGLSAMHAAGLGHLDVKATNVILRDGRTPVLVDFGLSGRHIRPGCGTVEYTAPEVLGVAPPGVTLSPPAADIYSFACLAYEMLTGNILFQAPDEMAFITRHVSHDGWLPELAAMNEVPSLGRLARVIAACLRHDPRNRLSALTLREKLKSALLPLADHPWPLQVPAQARVG